MLVVTYLEGVPAVMASEAGLVVGSGISSQLIDQVHRLVACRAFLRRSGETRHASLCYDPTPRQGPSTLIILPLILFLYYYYSISPFSWLWYLQPFYLQLERGKKTEQKTWGSGEKHRQINAGGNESKFVKSITGIAI